MQLHTHMHTLGRNSTHLKTVKNLPLRVPPKWCTQLNINEVSLEYVTISGTAVDKLS